MARSRALRRLTWQPREKNSARARSIPGDKSRACSGLRSRGRLATPPVFVPVRPRHEMPHACESGQRRRTLCASVPQHRSNLGRRLGRALIWQFQHFPTGTWQCGWLKMGTAIRCSPPATFREERRRLGSVVVPIQSLPAPARPVSDFGPVLYASRARLVNACHRSRRHRPVEGHRLDNTPLRVTSRGSWADSGGCRTTTPSSRLRDRDAGRTRRPGRGTRQSVDGPCVTHGRP
jgi:hypothetical protein